MRHHSGTPEILDRLACLTRIRDPEGIELNLLQVLQDLFKPQHILVFALDRRNEIRVVKRYLGGKEVTDMDEDELRQAPWARFAGELTQRGVRERSPQQELQCAEGFSTLAYPLVFSDPWNIGLALVFTSNGISHDACTLDALLKIYRNFCGLMDESQRDQLTGLLNRKTFDDNIQRVLQRTMEHTNARAENERRRTVHPDIGSKDAQGKQSGGSHAASQHSGNWLGIIDIDHFKRVNDIHGHLHGDEVLLLIAELLRTTFRDTDLIYRFGGEEFVVVLTSADSPGNSEAFDRFRERVAARNFPQIGHMTISFGATEITEHCNAHILLDRADQALYFAKKNGRNQGHLYEDLAERGEIAPVVQKYGDMELF